MPKIKNLSDGVQMISFNGETEMNDAMDFMRAQADAQKQENQRMKDGFKNLLALTGIDPEKRTFSMVIGANYETPEIKETNSGANYVLEQVGGYVEMFGDVGTHTVYVNEEGAINGMPLNVTASRILGYKLYGPAVFWPIGWDR